MKPHLRASLATAATVAFMLWILPALAHEAPKGWSYSAFCCNGSAEHGDCQSVPPQSVRVVDGGYEVTLKSGDHHMVTTPHTWFRDMKDVLLSKDENFHVCLYPDEATLRCLYVLPSAF